MQGIKRDQITFTRFVAAIGIVVFHFGAEVPPLNNEFFSLIFRSANMGVSYFFTLSGFIMIIAYAKNDHVKIFEYYRSRFARIAPAYYLALLLFVPSIINNYSGFDVVGLALNLSMLQAWVPSKALSVNEPGWSLSVELFFYLLFPFLFNSIYRSKKLWQIAGCAVVFFIASQAIYVALIHSDFYRGFPSASHNFIHYFPLMHLNEFLMGNVAGLFYIRYLADKSFANGPWIVILMLLLLVFLSFSPTLPLHNGILVVVFIPLIILISSDHGLFSRVMSTKPLVFLGEISFGIYILQLPVFSICFAINERLSAIDPSAFFYLYVVILCLLSALSFKFIETPLRKRINGVRIGKETSMLERTRNQN